MKYFKYAVVTGMIILIALPVIAQRRQLIKDPKAYISSAKIAMRDHPPRLEEAMGYLDTALAQHGPLPEAYFYRGNIYGEYATKEYNPAEKVILIGKMIDDYDSMYAACENDDVKSKYKKDCKEFRKIVDSVMAYYWRESYNNGVEALSRVENEYLPNWRNAADSSEKEYAQNALDAAIDTSKNFLLAAVKVDPDEHRSYEALGIIYDRLEVFDSSAHWFKKALAKAPDTAKPNISQNIAYAYIQNAQWDSSIVYFNRLLELVPDDVNTLINIAICYNNKQMFDSSFYYNKRVIAVDPTQSAAYIDVGQYFLWLSQQGFSDSISYYQKEGQNEKAKSFIQERDNLLDSAGHYYEMALENDPENVVALEQYSVIMLILGKYEKAETGFKKLTELEPAIKGHWINLGDTYVQMQKFEEAIEPFEEALKMDSTDTRLIETLDDLYESTGRKK